MVNCDFDNLSCYQNLIIYGAGNIGRSFYKQVKNKCSVKCFVDRNMSGGNIEGIPVVWLRDLLDVKDAWFVVTAVYDYRNICETIRTYFADAAILSIEDLISNSETAAGNRDTVTKCCDENHVDRLK